MKRTVLIAEDEIIVADDLEWQLTKLGYEVIGIAASGAEAMAMTDLHQPNIVLMDIQLQGTMNGIETAKLIQRTTGATIIFITAFPAVYLRDSDQIVPAGICLSKPFSTIQLKTALQSIADGTHRKDTPREHRSNQS